MILDALVVLFATMRPVQLSDLSPSRQAFVRVCQRTDLGEIVGLVLRDGEPVFGEQTEIFRDVKLDKDAGPRPELELNDYPLPAELIRLLRQFDAIGNGAVRQIEIPAGLPRRIVFDSPTPR